MAKGKYLRVPSPEETRARRRSIIGSIIFYFLYFAMIAAFVMGTSYGLGLLEDWLIRYEASQPNHKSQEVFEELFADPDWAALYAMAGEKDTIYENASHYAAYMEQHYGNAALSFMETSAGLSGDKKFIVQASGKKIATFTLTGGADSQTEIPQWELHEVEVFYTRREAVTVEKLPGHTVYINGVALDDSFTVRRIHTVAEEYLPEGLHGYRMETQQISGFLVAPEVTVKDENGADVEMVQDSESGIYRPVLSVTQMSAEEEAIALNGADIYCKWMIRAVYSSALGQVFDTTTPIYQAVRYNDTWMQDYLSYEFGEKKVVDYCRYSDSLFTARVQLSFFVTRMNGTVKEYSLDTTFFFTLAADGRYLITNMTNVDLSQQVDQVRLTFIDGETVLYSEFVDAAAQQLLLPSVTVPEGSGFAGWVRQEDDGNGKITLTVVFVPDENGMVYFTGEEPLQPMTLYTLFEEGGKG